MLKIVIIDGNAISRNLLTSVLSTGGYDVVGDANTSAAGMTSMVKLSPQIVTICTGDAENNGMEMIDTIRTLFPKSLVFLVSANMNPATLEGALQRGVHGFIIKPFNSASVLSTIRNAVLKLARQSSKPAE